MSLLQRFFFDFYPDKADAEAVWHRLMTHNPLRVKGSKINLNRFMPAIKKGIDEEPNWTMTYFIYLITCIESGYLNDAKFKGILKQEGRCSRSTQRHVIFQDEPMGVSTGESMWQPDGGRLHDVLRCPHPVLAESHQCSHEAFTCLA